MIRTVWGKKIILLCISAAGANICLNILFIDVLKIPLFVDTVFTAAICFLAGLGPGLITALLAQIANFIHKGSIVPFALCSFAEVLLICFLAPVFMQKHDSGKGPVKSRLHTARQEREIASMVNIFAGLLLLYIVTCIAISILGGLIDFFYHDLMSYYKSYFSAEDAFKIGLLRSGIPALAMNILSRIPVNIVDRFIVIFGGYFFSRGLSKF